MVFFGEKFSLRDASCCNVLVMNGAAGFRFFSFRLIPSSTSSAPSTSLTTASAIAWVGISAFFPSTLSSLPWNVGFTFPSRSSVIDQYSSDLKALISFSRSHTMRNATDCTRPALKPRCTFFHNMGLILYPTNRSRTRRACWALTLLTSTSVGFSIASVTAFFVISLNITRKIFPFVCLDTSFPI